MSDTSEQTIQVGRSTGKSVLSKESDKLVPIEQKPDTSQNHKTFMPDKFKKRKHRTDNPSIAYTSALIKKVFENFAIYRHSHCLLDKHHQLMNSQACKGAVIVLHALLQKPNVRQFLLTPEDRELYNIERVKMLFVRHI